MHTGGTRGTPVLQEARRRRIASIEQRITRSYDATTARPGRRHKDTRMDTELLSRIQFAVTIGFHFLFPPISIGLAWLLVVIETIAWKSGSDAYDRAGRFFGKLLGLTFAMGVATGIVMEFQFGTNWDRYSRVVGDIFGAPLAAEGVFAFFLESGFLGLYLFGRSRVSKKIHVLSIFMVAIGATLSAFWIIVANSWMQTPDGYTVAAIAPGAPPYVPGTPIDPTLYRAELTSFWAAVFNPSTMVRYLHTMAAAIVCGAFFMAGGAAWILRRDSANAMARGALKVSVIGGLIFSVLVAFPFGHEHAQQVARTQPEKFAAIEGLYTTQSRAPLVFFAYPQTAPPNLRARIEVPGLLSWLAFGDINAEIKGIDQFPPDRIPPLWLTFVSFHNMVLLGMFFIAVMALGAWLLYRGKLHTSRRVLMLFIIGVPLSLAACQFGWVAAEVGRQPWIVYGLMLTKDAYSVTVPAGQVLASLLIFGAVYLLLLVLYLYLLIGKLNHEAQGAAASAPAADGLASGL